MFKNNNIDLNLIKVAIFDFDETLALHKSLDYMKATDEDMFKKGGIAYEFAQKSGMSK